MVMEAVTVVWWRWAGGGDNGDTVEVMMVCDSDSVVETVVTLMLMW